MYLQMLAGATLALLLCCQRASAADARTVEARLREDPELRRFAESRRKLSEDRYRPLYHFASPVSKMNDPNGLCFWQGRWHLFYQANPAGDNRVHWGHAVSKDLVHWRDLPYAIRPGPEKSCFSGSILVEQGRAIAAYHGLGAGTMVAVASDPLLLDWRKVGGKPVISCSVNWATNLGKAQLPGWKGSPAPKDALNMIYDPCGPWPARPARHPGWSCRHLPLRVPVQRDPGRGFEIEAYDPPAGAVRVLDA